mmetsp:Transcript_24705/g.61756  ORF Transcript_24705/g.61756 Transcript_24705/m.61756 type:complete len:133 (-) Transcript_24705:1172-1570(-)
MGIPAQAYGAEAWRAANPNQRVTEEQRQVEKLQRKQLGGSERPEHSPLAAVPPAIPPSSAPPAPTREHAPPAIPPSPTLSPVPAPVLAPSTDELFKLSELRGVRADLGSHSDDQRVLGEAIGLVASTDVDAS